MLEPYGKKKQLLLLRGSACPAERAQVFCGGRSKDLDTAKCGDWEPGSCRISDMGGWDHSPTVKIALHGLWEMIREGNERQGHQLGGCYQNGE